MSIFGTDPNQQAQLALAAGLLGGRGSLNSIIGQALMGGQAAFQDASMFQQRKAVGESQMRRAQFEEEQARKAAEQRERDAAMLKAQFGQLPGPTADGSALMPKFDPMSMLGGGATPDAVMQAVQLQQAMTPKKAAPIKGGPGDQFFDPETHQKLFSVDPKPPAEDDFVARMRAAGIDPGSQQGRAMLMQKLRKDSTHQPPIAQISYGQPMPAVNPKTGEVELVRPDNKGGMTFSGVKPAPQDRDVKLPAELQRMQIAGETMDKLLVDYEKMLDKHDPRNPATQANPAVRAQMQSLKRNMELQFKELQALGALAGPDIEIMRQALADPFSVAGAYYGKDGLKAQIAESRKLVKLRKEAVSATQKPASASPAASAPEDPLGLRQ